MAQKIILADSIPSAFLGRLKLTGIMAVGRPPNRAAFRELFELLKQNTHFNGALEMLERLEAALKGTRGYELPVPREFNQLADCTLCLVWSDLSILVSHDTIVWRFCKTGGPRSVNDAATVGIPQEILDALAQIVERAKKN